jgi:hypothetical protein
MPDEDLQSLIRRRLWELARTGEEAARRARWTLPAETVERLARRGGKSFITEGLAPYLAQALRVPENRVRKAAGLPLVPDDRASITTQPHIWLVAKRDDARQDDAAG